MIYQCVHYVQILCHDVCVLVCSYWRPEAGFCWTEPLQIHCWQNTGTLLHSPLVVHRYENRSLEFQSVFSSSPWDLSQCWKTSHSFAMRTWARRQRVRENYLSNVNSLSHFEFNTHGLVTCQQSSHLIVYSSLERFQKQSLLIATDFPCKNLKLEIIKQQKLLIKEN